MFAPERSCKRDLQNKGQFQNYVPVKIWLLRSKQMYFLLITVYFLQLSVHILTESETIKKSDCKASRMKNLHCQIKGYKNYHQK